MPCCAVESLDLQSAAVVPRSVKRIKRLLAAFQNKKTAHDWGKRRLAAFQNKKTAHDWGKRRLAACYKYEQLHYLEAAGRRFPLSKHFHYLNFPLATRAASLIPLARSKVRRRRNSQASCGATQPPLVTSVIVHGQEQATKVQACGAGRDVRWNRRGPSRASSRRLRL